MTAARILSFATAAFFAATATGFAQETTEETTTENGIDSVGFNIGQDLNAELQVGDRYLTEEHGDWAIRCVKTNAENDPCHLYQLMNGPDGSPLAEISLNPLPDGGRAVAGANIMTPLETLLTAPLAIQIDAGARKGYPYSLCTLTGCLVRVGLTAEDLAAYKAGAKATMLIVPAATPESPIALELSLSGFTAGFDAMLALMNGDN